NPGFGGALLQIGAILLVPRERGEGREGRRESGEGRGERGEGSGERGERGERRGERAGGGAERIEGRIRPGARIDWRFSVPTREGTR
ncbi:MAG: hypothetical protein J0H64_02945, partial [Actinobacteria bacterium]|nr:hypothetical protein [Actinomycetota bacterium]